MNTLLLNSKKHITKKHLIICLLAFSFFIFSPVKSFSSDATKIHLDDMRTAYLQLSDYPVNNVFWQFIEKEVLTKTLIQQSKLSKDDKTSSSHSYKNLRMFFHTYNPSKRHTTTKIDAPCALSISSQPTGTAVCNGGTHEMSITASGGTLTYQWQSSSDELTWNDISGATSSSYTTPALTSTTFYRCVVSDSEGTLDPITSNTATVTVVSDPSITTQPTGASVCFASTHTISVVAAGGTPSLTYQWQSSSNEVDWSNISGATASTYTTGSLISNKYYKVTISASGSGCGSSTSSSVLVTAYSPLTAGLISSNQTICYNASPATLEGTNPTGGSGTYLYQWQQQANCAGDWTDVVDANSINYSPGVLTEATCYRRKVTDNLCGTAYSTVITPIDGLKLHYTFDNSSAIVTDFSGNNNHITIAEATSPSWTPNGINGGAYQFDGIYDFIGMGNVLDDDLAAAPASISIWVKGSFNNGNQIVFGHFASKIGLGFYKSGEINYFIVTVGNNALQRKPIFNVNNEFVNDAWNHIVVTYDASLNSTFWLNGVQITNTGTADYWIWNVDEALIGKRPTGSHFKGFIDDFRIYNKALVSSEIKSLHKSHSLKVSVYPELVAGEISSAQTICYNTTPLALTGAAPSGGNAPYSYQWQSSTNGTDFNDISGEILQNYSPAELTQSTWYRRVDGSSSDCGFNNTNDVKITVRPNFIAGEISSAQTICYNAFPATLEGTEFTDNSGTYSFQWQQQANCTGDWTDIMGATFASYSPEASTETSCFRRMVTDHLCGFEHPTPINISDGLKLHYTFDNSSATVTDFSGNNNHITIAQATSPLWTPNGINGGAYQFDGINSFIDMGNVLDDDLSAPPASISLWVKGSFNNGNQIVFGHFASKIGLGFYKLGGINYFIVTVGGGPQGKPIFNVNNEFVNDAWNHIVVTYDASLNSTFWLNGVQITNTGTADFWTWGVDEALIGKRPTGNHFKGSIDDFKIYNRILTPSEINNALKVTVQTPPVPSGLSAGDYFWSGVVSDSWNSSQNWLSYDGSSYSVASEIPDENSNVFIQTYSDCATTYAKTNASDMVYVNDLNIASEFSLGELSKLNIKGNWNNSGTFDSGTGTVEFSGSSQQTIKSNGSSFYDLSFNNTQGTSSAILLTDDLVITNSATFTNGIVNTGGHSLTFGNSASSTLGNTNSYVNGVITKTGSSAFHFAIGEGNAYGPCAIDAPAAASTITAQYIHSAGPANWNTGYMCSGSGLDHTSGVEHWELTTTASYPAVTLNWNRAESGVLDLPDLTVAHWNGTCWKNMGGTAGGANNAGSITSTVPFTSYSPITLGTKTKDNPLPIELAAFEAVCKADAKHIHWTTLTEVNNHYFTLEKSLNGIDFEFVAQIQGEGNSNQIKEYNYQDNDLSNDVIYYRLSQTDFDGTEKVFPMISVDCSQEQEISIVPNPFKSTITMSGLPSDCLIDIYGSRGEKIQSIQHHDSNMLEINLEHLSVGIYFIRIFDANGTSRNFKIVKN